MPSGRRWARAVTGEGGAVVDASLVVDFVLGGSHAMAIGAHIDGLELWAPAHIDAEILLAVGRMQRAGELTAREAGQRLDAAMDIPLRRELLDDLVAGAWRRRNRLRLADALYVELASRHDMPLLTTDARLGRAVRIAEVITP